MIALKKAVGDQRRGSYAGITKMEASLLNCVLALC